MCPAFPPICSQSPGPRRIAGIRRKTFHCKGRYMLPGDFAGQLCQWGCGWKGGFRFRRRFRFRCTGPAGRHFRSDSCTSRRPPGSKRRFSEEEGFFSVPAGFCADFSVSGDKNRDRWFFHRSLFCIVGCILPVMDLRRGVCGSGIRPAFPSYCRAFPASPGSLRRWPCGWRRQ